MATRGLIKRGTTSAPKRKVPKTVTNKGTIKPSSNRFSILGASAAALGDIVPGLASGVKSFLQPDGSVVHMRRKRHKGLTYNEIRGAMKLLKLVKRFAPAGHRTALRARPRRASVRY